MANSNSRNANMRKRNRQLVIADRKDREMRRETQRPPMRSAKLQQLTMVAMAMGLFKQALGFWQGISRSFFRRTTFNLDLTRKSTFEPGQRRDAGINWLRGVFPGLGATKFISTRDGRPV